MKRDEPFNPDVKSEEAPAGLLFRAACHEDRETITHLMAARNPSKELAEVYQTTDRELANMERGSKYRLYVADLNGNVIGFCRFYHSEGLPQSKKKFPAPEGWYGMGIMVAPEWRRKGIARFLSANRLKALRAEGAVAIYSIVDETNFTSLRMHREFGFEEIARAPGFLHLALESGGGILFRRAT